RPQAAVTRRASAERRKEGGPGGAAGPARALFPRGRGRLREVRVHVGCGHHLYGGDEMRGGGVGSHGMVSRAGSAARAAAWANAPPAARGAPAPPHARSARRGALRLATYLRCRRGG